MLFLNIDFLWFRRRFWGVLGLQVGAKLAILASNSPIFWMFFFGILLNGDLEASKLDFGGPGPRFWRPRASILEAILGVILGVFDVKNKYFEK